MMRENLGDVFTESNNDQVANRDKVSMAELAGLNQIQIRDKINDLQQKNFKLIKQAEKQRLNHLQFTNEFKALKDNIDRVKQNREKRNADQRNDPNSNQSRVENYINDGKDTNQ